MASSRLPRLLTSSPVLGFIVGALTWPIFSIAPTIGPDPSWVAGLYMAHEQGLQFGTQFVFTYGPLGFLQEPVLYDETKWVLAFLYRAFIHVALAISLIWVGRRVLPLAVALCISYALLAIGYMEGEVVLLAFIWCFVAVGEGRPRFAAVLIAVGGGAIAVVELLGKVNFGIAVFSLCSIALLALPDRRRNLPLFGGIMLIGLFGSWLLTDQSLADVPEFLSNISEVISGYSRSMSTDIGDVDWERPLAIAAIALVFAGAALVSRKESWPRRCASLSLVAVFTFLTFKQGFVRQGLGGTPAFFSLMLGAGIAISARMPARLVRVPASAVAVVLLAPLVALTVAASPSPSLWQSLKPDDHAEFLRGHLEALFEQGERNRLVSQARQSMRGIYRIDQGMLQAIAGRPVHLEPWEIGVAWAYGLNWHPLPVIQGYSAYTPRLDQLNKEALSGPAGPSLILRQNTRAFSGFMDSSIDDRYIAWDPPAATLAMLCHYRNVLVSHRWQLLERAGSRCGQPRPIGTIQSRTGRNILVPRPPGESDIVFARIEGVGVEGWESLRALLYRARQRMVILDGHRSWRLVPETASDGLIMRASKGADYPTPFQLAPGAESISVRIEGGPPRDIRVRFFAQRVGSIERRLKPIPRS